MPSQLSPTMVNLPNGSMVDTTDPVAMATALTQMIGAVQQAAQTRPVNPSHQQWAQFLQAQTQQPQPAPQPAFTVPQNQ